MNTRPPCPRCPKTGSEDVDLSEAIRLYVETLDEDLRCSGEEYSRRLWICEGCEGMVNATCVHCGCYVGMRAAVAVRRCPHPARDKWE